MINLVLKISFVSPVLPILLFLVLAFNWKEKGKWVIFLLLLIGLIVDFRSNQLIIESKTNGWLINVYTLIEFGVLSFFFFFQFKKKLQNFIFIAFLMFTLTWIIRTLFINSISNFDSSLQAIEFLLLLCYCSIYFFEKAKVTSPTFIYTTYQFWIVSALLMYCAGTFFSFFIPTKQAEMTDDILVFEYISRFGNIFKSLLIAVAFCINQSKQQPKSNTRSMYTVHELKD